VCVCSLRCYNMHARCEVCEITTVHCALSQLSNDCLRVGRECEVSLQKLRFDLDDVSRPVRRVTREVPRVKLVAVCVGEFRGKGRCQLEL
jgi:hypothetical protein